MFRCGYVAIVGVPNIGKSTLINALLDEKLSIVTDKPQTTRHRILGILNRPHAQILFLDTPGIHESKKLLNESMVEAALRTLGDADVVMHLIPPKATISDEDLRISEKIRELHKPYIVLINKIDRADKEALLPLMQKINESLRPQEIIPISALHGDGIQAIVPLLETRLPEGPALYPTDQYTEHDVRFLCAEIVREKATKLLHEEIPYALATEVEAYEEGVKLDKINIAILVEKPSQKGIVIGAKGSMLKKIGQFAREDIEKMLGKKVYLELFVKVEPDWTKNNSKLRELGIIS